LFKRFLTAPAEAWLAVNKGPVYAGLFLFFWPPGASNFELSRFAKLTPHAYPVPNRLLPPAPCISLAGAIWCGVILSAAKNLFSIRLAVAGTATQFAIKLFNA